MKMVVQHITTQMHCMSDEYLAEELKQEYGLKSEKNN